MLTPAAAQAMFNKSSLAALTDEYFLEAMGVDREGGHDDLDMDTSPSCYIDSAPPAAMLAHAQQLSSVLSEAELHEAILAEVELQQQQQHHQHQAAFTPSTPDSEDQVAVAVLESGEPTQLQVSGFLRGGGWRVGSDVAGRYLTSSWVGVLLTCLEDALQNLLI
jgi:hypothetical protein